MSHLLDANACIDHLRHGPASNVSAKLLTAPVGTVFLCSVVVGELQFGARRTTSAVATLSKVRAFCSPYVSLPFDDWAAEKYAIIRAHLAALATPIGSNNLMIAAIALATGLTLVSHNTKDFSRVPGLLLEDWQ